MPSLAPLSTYALSEIEGITFVPEALQRLATALTADPIIFMEITARANEVTTSTDVIPSMPGVYVPPVSALPLSAMTIPSVTRESTSFFFATRPWTGSPSDTNRANQRAIPRIITAGRITRSSPVESSTPRRGQRTIGDVRLYNPDGGLDHLLTDYTLEGGTVRVWLGEPDSTSDTWALLYEATIGESEGTRQEIRISITTIQDQLKRALQLRRYSGAGGYGGDLELKNRLRPVAYGEVWGAAPVLISKADNIYQIHDGQIHGIDNVWEGGLAFTPTSDYPDFNALQLATLNLGEYATCYKYGLFRIGTTLAGLVYPIRVDFQGDAAGPGYVSATGDVLYRIARDRAFVASIELDVNAFNGLPKARIGYYANGSTEKTCENVFDELLGAIVSTYGVGRSQKISISRMIPAANQLDDVAFRGEQFFDLRVENKPYTPRNAQPYTYGITWDPLTEDEVSPLADASVAVRLKRENQAGTYVQASTAVIPQYENPVLTTYFIEETPALEVAEDALAFSAESLYPLRMSLGRLGLLADIGNVVGVTESRFIPDTGFRGVVYEQEDNLGATVTSRVSAIG